MEIKYECPICHQKFESRLNRDRCENVHMEKQRAENDKIMDIFRKFSDGYVDSYEKYLEARQLFLDTSDAFMEFLKENGDEIPKEDQKKIVDRISELDAKYDDDDIEDDDDIDDDDDDGDDKEIVGVLSDIIELLGAILHDKDENDDNV